MKRLSVLGRFQATADEHGLLPRGSKVLVAVSGGADSVCLLHLLRSVAGRRRLALTGFHLNHRIRPEAGRDERFVRGLFERAGLDCRVVWSDVRGYARRHRLGLEEAGRELRYRHMTRVAKRLGCDRVALGHTADDNLETMVLNLVRGAGPHGLAGIPVRRGIFVRPMLDIERAALVGYLAAAGAEWVEDETNADPGFRRNRVRLNVIPELRAINPAAVANARRAARLLQQEDEYLAGLAAAALAGAVRRGRGRTLIDTRKLESYNPVLMRRIVKMLVPGLDAAAVERVLEFLGRGSGRLVLAGATLRHCGRTEPGMVEVSC